MAPLSAPWTLLLGMILQKTTMSDFERIAAKQIQQFSRILDDKVLDSLKGLLWMLLANDNKTYQKFFLKKAK